MSNFFAWFNDFVTNDAKYLRRSELVVVMALARFADTETLESYPSMRRLAEICGLSIPSISRALHGLADRGLVTWYPGTKLGHRGQTYSVRVFKLVLAGPADTVAPMQPRLHRRNTVAAGATRNEVIST